MSKKYIVAFIAWVLFFGGIILTPFAQGLGSVLAAAGSIMLMGRIRAINQKLQGDYGLDTIYVYPFPALFLLWFAADAYPGMMLRTLQIFFALSTVWLPFFLLYSFWVKWIEYVRGLLLNNAKFVLLEIKLPKIITKSPRAMETFITGLFLPQGETTFIDRWWLGKTRAYFSLELVSLEGQVHFYLWTRETLKNHVEAHLYAQYPEVEVREVPDYAKSVDFNTEEWRMHCIEMKFLKPDPYPIKTYVDYELDKDPKTEHIVDPLANVIETLGSMGKNEYLWIQIIVRAHKKTDWHGIFGKDPLPILASEEKRKLLEQVKKDVEAATGQPMDRPVTYRDVSEQQRTMIKAIDRAVAKLSFHAGFRVLYFAPKEYYHPINERVVGAIFRAFETTDLNGLRATRGTNKFDFPWQDFRGIRARQVMRSFFGLYRKRAYFFWPYQQQHLILNAEELATLWHFPSEAVATPTLERIPAKTGGAPANLPTAPHAL